MTTSEAKALESLGRAGQDPRSGEEYARALAVETARSLRQDPSRWQWTYSREARDGNPRGGQRRKASP